MLEEILKEIDELKGYKKRYENAIKEKAIMSDLLYAYMIREYEDMGREERISRYREEYCRHCRYGDACEIGLPENIWKPILSNDRAWIPSRVSCIEFEWA